jgi:hypothetical protein
VVGEQPQPGARKRWLGERFAAEFARSLQFVAVGQRKTRAIPFKPFGSVRVVEVRAGSMPPAPDHPGFPLCRTAYFFLAARPRPAGAARNEMPVRIAFC